MMKLLLTFLFFNVLLLQSFAQGNLDKLSKKELKELAVKQESDIALKSAEIEQNKRELLKIKEEQVFLEQENLLLKDSLKMLISKADSALAEALYSRELASKNIEVLDIYSFGYQPFRNNEAQYSQFLKEIQKTVVKYRMNHIRQLYSLMNSFKIAEEQKMTLFLSFRKVYSGYLDEVTKSDFYTDYQTLESKVFNGVERKTQNELSGISLENRWIILLESQRH